MARAPPTTVMELAELEKSITLPHFTADDAWTLGNIIRKRLVTDYTTPAIITILSSNSSQLLFHSISRSGTTLDNDIWVRRKTTTVIRFGVSSYLMHVKLGGDEKKFADKFMLGDRAGDYAIHGGAVPVRVKGVEGAVAVAVVSGLKQEQDHMVVIEGQEELLRQMGGA